jgi:putative hydrolase of the HAD superfamily
LGAVLACVFFDLYGTLVEIETDEGSARTQEAFEDWVARAHDSAAAAREHERPLFEAIRRATAPGPFGEPDLGPVIAAHLEPVLGRTPDPHEVAAAATAFRGASRSRLTLVPGAVDALRRLADRFRLGLVSNAQSLFTRPELEELGLSPWFDPLVISSEVGVRKPGREIFARALAAAGTDPAHALHVGDDPHADVEGAAAVGMRTCLVGPAVRRAELRVAPDLRADSVAELPALLST